MTHSTNSIRVLDASVVINLLAIETAVARRVLVARGGDFAITALVLERETLQDPRTERTLAEPRLAELSAGGLIERVELNPAAQDRFVELAISLDDGEAATIACSESLGAIAVMDDGRGQSTAAKCGVRIETTTDLLLHPAVSDALGLPKLADAVHDALRLGRMRVFERHLQRVIELIGTERAASCTSIPRRALRALSQQRDDR